MNKDSWRVEHQNLTFLVLGTMILLCHSLHRRNLAGTRLALKIYPPLEIFTAKMEVEGNQVEWTSGFHVAS